MSERRNLEFSGTNDQVIQVNNLNAVNQNPQNTENIYKSSNAQVNNQSNPQVSGGEGGASKASLLGKLNFKILLIILGGVALVTVLAVVIYFGVRKKEILVPIISTNDIHGYFYEREYNTTDGTSYSYGGLKFFEAYVNLLREEFGPEGVLYLDGGDQYKGGVESQKTNGAIIAEFMNIVLPNATTIGNHEYDENIKFLKEKVSFSKFPFLACNVYDKSTNSHTPFGENQLTSKVFNVNATNGQQFKIGVIGLSYDMSVKSISGEGFENIGFDNYVEAIEKEADKIREETEVDAMILLSHIGLECGSNVEYNNYTKETEQLSCETDTELYQVLNELKPGVIDAVVSADTHYEVHHWINGIPIISGKNNGAYTNIMYLPFEKKGYGSYSLKQDKIFIEGALPICEKVFEKTQLCQIVEKAKGLGKLVSLTFHGKNLETSNEVKQLWDKYYQLFQESNIYVFSMTGPFDVLYGGRDNKNGDNHFGNMVSDFLKEIAKSDFSVINPGGFRTYWYLGSITQADFDDMFPFSNDIVKVEYKGSQIKKIFMRVHYGYIGKGPYNTAGLYHESDGQKVTLLKMYKADGTLDDINDDTYYTLGTINFMIPEDKSKQKGDDFNEPALNDTINDWKSYQKIGTEEFKMEFMRWLKEKGDVDMNQFYDENKRRFVIKK